jgi:hypothetical protein
MSDFVGAWLRFGELEPVQDFIAMVDCRSARAALPRSETSERCSRTPEADSASRERADGRGIGERRETKGS